MQTASTNIGERLCNKSIRDISWLLNIPHSTVSGIITKWKQLGTTATQPPSGRSRHMTERGQRMLKRTVRRSRQMSAESIAKDLQTWCGLQMSTTTVRRDSWNGFPWPSSCIQALHHQVQCKALDAVV
ncbi:unnamed protein product [Staurois parvus]|uniref:Transposase Tc1-like domain-containing protein n=1 Tax=Staurois parvus TaxID=386267 RepID=A0ABN9BS24_9NEOB|nr:unnamed protein product [Staurois parvus]